MCDKNDLNNVGKREKKIIGIIFIVDAFIVYMCYIIIVVKKVYSILFGVVYTSLIMQSSESTSDFYKFYVHFSRIKLCSGYT